MSLMIGLAILLIVVILILIFRVQSALSAVKGDDEKKGFGLNKLNATLFLIFMGGMFGLFFWYTFGRMDDYMLPEASTIHGKITDSMLWVSLVICIIVMIVVNALLFVFAHKYQYKKETKAKFFPDNSALELAWTVIPAIVLTYLIFNGWQEWTNITDTMTTEQIQKQNVVELEVVGEQFKWSCRYPGADGKLGTHYFRRIDAENSFGLKVEDKAGLDDFTPREIHLPAGRKAIIYIRAKDVLHSVFIPHFRVKMDAVPGSPTKFSFVPDVTTSEMRQKLNNPDFNYEMVCAEICGNGHFNMRYKVVVETEKEYQKWYTSQKPWSKGSKDYILEQLQQYSPSLIGEYATYLDQLSGEKVEYVTISGLVKDAEGNPLLAKVSVINNETGDISENTVSDASGKYSFSLPKGSDYGVTYSLENYLFSSQNVNLGDDYSGTKFNSSDVVLSKIEVGAKVALRNVFFDTGSAHLKRSSKQELHKLILLLEENSHMKIALIGHTDSQGDDVANMTLSEERAHAVKSYLLDFKIKKSRLEHTGKGETEPVADNETAEGRELNRRTELSIVEL